MSKSKNNITSGTKEWADSNCNIYSGCSNNCSYCYAKKMAIRFKRKTNENWPVMELNEKAFRKGYSKRKGRIMFPTSHDITPETVNNCIIVLKKILRAGNEVLITTKPDPICIIRICDELRKYKSQIQFRFTITSINDDILKKWEPNAPLFEQRLHALKHAYIFGWKTSISMEPCLDKNPIPLIMKLSRFVSESMWFGMLNYCKTEFNTFKIIIKIIEDIKHLPEIIRSKIRIKDSIRNLYKKHNLEVGI